MASKSRAFNSELLASVAPVASEVMFDVSCARGPQAGQPPSSAGANIAVLIHLIDDALKSQPIYQLSPDIQTLSYKALLDLLEICTWPNYSARALSPQDIYNTLVKLFQSDKDKMNKSINKFLKQKPDHIKPYQDRFADLSGKLNQHEQYNNVDDLHLKPRDEDVYPEQINRTLIDILRKHFACSPASHAVQGRDAIQLPWHHTRICLNNGVQTRQQLAHVELIIAAKEMEFWQEISLGIPIKLRDNSSASDSDGDLSDSSDPDLIRIKRGAVCQMLNEQHYNRVRLRLDQHCRLHKCRDPEVPQHFASPGHGVQLSNLLKNGTELSVEHKVTLAYAVARACWQFYNSDLMDARWSSDNIWFMPVDSQPNNRIPLKAFISFPFGHYNPSPKEYLEEGGFTHRYPRILFLGIILLEIGLGKPLGLESSESSKLSFLAHTNKAHAKAKMRLNELKHTPWDGFSFKDTFVEAIENCLESRNFKETQRHPPARKRRKRLQLEPECQDSNTHSLILLERRVALYRKVVAPLFWLANVGFNPSGDVPFVTIRKIERRKSTFAEGDEFQQFWREIKRPTFDTGRANGQPEIWLERLKVISGHVLRCRLLAKVTTPIRVAILDTGCNKNLPFFQNGRISNCFKEWRDFAAGSQSHVDAFGHGTFMARLVLQVAPFVDLCVARVAETQDQLESNEEKIAQAIECAGLEWKADVISMSFGFPKTSTVISDAIDKVKKQRPIIFLASAGNSSSDRGEAFPARHPSIISIYATDYQGAFLKTNPTRSRDGPRILGTYGDNIAKSILSEVQKEFPKGDFSPGTSIATAVAAGIVAMTLSYTVALPGLLQIKEFDEVFDKLRTGEGMNRMLQVMAQGTDFRGDFINPIRFWSERSKDKDFFVAICKADFDISS